MKKSSLAAFAFALLAAAAPFAALLVPPAAPTPLTDFVQADDLSPAATPQPLPTMPPSNAQNGTTVPDAVLAAADITLYDADTGTNRIVSVRDFLIGAAACEMPPTWNDDTLLAQMVASHSYALAMGEPMQVNSALCAGWTDTEVLEARWGDDFTAYYSRFAALADEAAGALLCYGGAPAAACYHSISNGVTEASQNVWTSALPYLQGVASPWDKTADGYETTITYSCEQVDAILQGITDPTQRTVVSYALTKVGYPYSQQYRDTGNYYDCSSLAYYSWKAAGIDISYGGANTAAAEAEGLDSAGHTVAYADMQPGDLIFYSYERNGRYKNISHVAVYVGNGMVVEAKGVAYGVTYNAVPNVGSIVLIGRPQ